jgi:hypothetical protein
VATTPLISICASAVEVSKWDEFFGSIEETKIPYEVVFVGDKKPSKEYNNLRFIYSEVKPAQCHQIAVLNSSGEYIHITADDAVYPKRYFDEVVPLLNERVVICSDTFERGMNCDWDTFRLGNFFMSPFAIFSRKLFDEVGGYDNRYVTGQFENDFCMMLHSRLVPFVHYDKRITVNHVASSKFSQCHDVGRIQLRKSWCTDEYSPSKPDGIFLLNRKDEHHPYVEKDILTVSQGSTDNRWK